MHKIVLVVPLAAVAALVAGCGGSSSKADVGVGSTSPAPATGTSTVTTPPPSSASTTTPSGPAACATDNLALSLGPAGGAAGSLYYPLHFVNKGTTSCTMTGYPGVSFVAPGNGQQVGKAGTRPSEPTPTVTLAPGGEATATVQIGETGNFSPADCGPTAVSGLRIYPPGNTAAAYVAFPSPQQACSKDLTSTGSNQLVVHPVKAGATGI